MEVRVRRLFRSKVFRRYVVINLCFVLAPLLLMVTLYYNNAQQQVDRNVLAAQEVALTQAMRGVDRDMSTFQSIAVQSAYDNVLTPYLFRSGGFSSIKAIGRLRLYRANMDFLDEVMLYFRHDDMLYTSSGSCSLSVFTGSLYEAGPSAKGEAFGELLNAPRVFGVAHLRERLAQPTFAGRKYIALTYPVGTQNAVVGSFVGVMPIQYLDVQLADLLADTGGAALIADHDGSFIIHQTQRDLSLEEQPLLDLLAALGTGAATKPISVEDQPYYAVQRVSEVNGWRYISILPKRPYAINVFYEAHPSMTLIFGLLTVSLLTGIFIAYQYYAPIYRLSALVGGKARTAPEADELQQVNLAIHRMIGEEEMLRQELDANRVEMRQRLILDLLNSRASLGNETYTRRLAEAGIALSSPFYMVLVLSHEKWPDAAEQERLLARIEDEYTADVYGAELLYKDYVAVLLSLPEEGVREEAIDQFLRRINGEGLRYQIGVGRVYASPALINRSLLDAITALERALASDFFHESAQRIAYYDQWNAPRDETMYWYPSEAQNRLMQGLRQANETVAREALVELGLMLEEYALSHDAVSLRFIFNSIVQQMLPLLQEVKINEAPALIDRLIHATGSEDFLADLRALCEEILSNVGRKRDMLRMSLFRDILQYLDTHFCDHDLSLRSLAEEFNMTTSSFSKLFRDFSGENYVEYVSGLRMKKACELLAETDLRIRDIMERVGYSDLSSFTRKFTQTFGMAPGRYREAALRNRQGDQ